MVKIKTTTAPKKRAQPKTGDERQEIFEKLKNILSAQVPPLTVSQDLPGRFELISKKAVVINGVKKPFVYFGSVIIQGSYVGLYLMHVYARPDLLTSTGPALLKTLKGKACFHIRKLDSQLEKEISLAVKDGIACYRKLAFI